MDAWESVNKHRYQDRLGNRQSIFRKFIKYIAGVVFLAFVTYAGLLFVGYITMNQLENVASDSIQRMNTIRQESFEKQKLLTGVLSQEKPRMERKWVEGKSAKECRSSDGVLNNKTVECMNGHYEYKVVQD